ncbi:hypothetical protein [Streptomyces sp. NPDC001286]
MLPINALLGLCEPYDVNPAPLANAGFRVAALEVPLACDDGGKVTADVVLMNDSAGHIVLCESKSGNNIKVEQAVRYGKISATSVVQAASITVPRTAALTVEVLYVGLHDHAERMMKSLESAEVPYPLLVADDEVVTLLRMEMASEVLREAMPPGPLPLEAPPIAYIELDHESDDSVFVNPVRSYLVQAATHRETTVSVRVMTERVCPYYLSYGKAARGALVKKVQRAARLVVGEHPGTYRYTTEPGGGEGFITILRTPEDYDARGRTQAYQALSRVSQTRSKRSQVDPNQLDLLHELADDGDSEVDDQEETP